MQSIPSDSKKSDEHPFLPNFHSPLPSGGFSLAGSHWADCLFYFRTVEFHPHFVICHDFDEKCGIFCHSIVKCHLQMFLLVLICKKVRDPTSTHSSFSVKCWCRILWIVSMAKPGFTCISHTISRWSVVTPYFLVYTLWISLGLPLFDSLMSSLYSLKSLKTIAWHGASSSMSPQTLLWLYHLPDTDTYSLSLGVDVSFDHCVVVHFKDMGWCKCM